MTDQIPIQSKLGSSLSSLDNFPSGIYITKIKKKRKRQHTFSKHYHIKHCIIW